MSSTYVSGYRALAFRTSRGHAFCLFHQTAESNLHPQTPHWSAHMIGHIDDIGARVTEYAYCCDDGMTRGPRGVPIRAEHYIERSEDAVRNAWLFEGEITLEFGRYLSSIPTSLLERFDDLANALGLALPGSTSGKDDWLQHCRTLSLTNPLHGDLICQFNAAHRKEALAWRIFKHPPMGERLIEPGPWTVPVLSKLERAAVKVSTEQHLAKYRVVPLSFKNSGYTDQRDAVVDDDGTVVSLAPLAWFCKGWLRQVNSERLGASQPALACFRSWVKEAKSRYPAALPFEALTGLEGVFRGEASNYVRDKVRDLAGTAEYSQPFMVQPDQHAWYCLNLVTEGLQLRAPTLAQSAQRLPAALF